MSGHGHDHDDAGAHTGHDELETSSDDFPADEPRSPAWLPLLGAALLLAGIFTVAVMSSGDKTAEQLAGEAAAASAGKPAPPIAPNAALPANHPQLPAPNGH